MSKEPFIVDRTLLEASIKDAEKDGPLTNLSELWRRSCAFYNEQLAYLAKQPNAPTIQFVTPSVISLRAKIWNIQILTVAGAKGRKRSPSNPPNTPKVKLGRKERLKGFAGNFAKMRRLMPKKFHKFIDRAEKGSIKEAVRVKCLDCSHFEKKEIAHCKVKGCALFPYRPYQNSSDVGLKEIEEKPSKLTSLPVLGNLQ